MFQRNRGRMLCVAAALAASCATAAMAADFTLTSTTFEDGHMMPRRVANTAASHTPPNPNCVGENISPQLSWTNVPKGTRSLALIVQEPEGRGGSGTYHFVAYGIPASVTSFAEGELGKASAHFVGGKSSHGLGLYSGPCTAPGPAHHYAYILIATDLDARELPAGLTRDELLAKIIPASGQSHSKGATSIVGYFQNEH